MKTNKSKSRRPGILSLAAHGRPRTDTMKGALIALADTRVGIEPEDRLRWLLELIQRTNLAPLTPEQRLALAAEVHVFTNRSAATPQLGLWSDLDQNDASSLAATVSEIRAGIESLLRFEPWGIEPRRAALVIYNLGAGRGQYVYDGPLVDRFRLAAHRLAFDQLARIGRCARDGCDRLFAIVKRAKFCSPSCSHKDRNARWLDKLSAKKDPIEIYQERRVRYVAQVASRLGITEKLARKMVRERGPRRRTKRK